jgi:predicted RNase H-like HicB family nuclease
MSIAKYTILYTDEAEGGFSGQCLELPGATSEGEIIKELKANMVDAVYLVSSSINGVKQKDDNTSFCLVYSGCDFDPVS